MRGLLMDRADAVMGCTENSPEEAELAALTEVIEAYQRQRWPDGKFWAARVSYFPARIERCVWRGTIVRNLRKLQYQTICTAGNTAIDRLPHVRHLLLPETKGRKPDAKNPDSL